MDEQLPLQKGRIPVMLATPLPDTPEYREVGVYLRNLVLMGVIDLHVPTIGNLQKFKFVQNGSDVRVERDFIDPVVLHATVEPQDNIGDFFKAMDAELDQRNQNGIVLYGSATSSRSVKALGGGISIEVPKYSYDPETDEPNMTFKFENILVSIGTVPTYIPPTGCSRLTAAVCVSNTEFPGVDNKAVVQQIIDSIPGSKPYQVLTEFPDGSPIIRVSNGHTAYCVAESGQLSADKAKDGALQREIEEELRLHNEIDWRSDATDVVYAEGLTPFLAKDADDIAAQLQRAVQHLRCEKELPNPKEIAHQGFSLKAFHEFQIEIYSDVEKVQRTRTLLENLKSEHKENFIGNKKKSALDKKFFGNKERSVAISELIDIADEARGKIDLILGKYGSLSDPEMEFADTIRLASAILVHKGAVNAIDVIRNTRSGSASFQDLMPRETRNVDAIIRPIPERTVNRIVLNVGTVSEGVGDDEIFLIDVADEAHGYAISDLRQQAKNSATVGLSKEELALVDSTAPRQKASESFRSLSSEIERDREGSVVSRMAEITRAVQTDSGRGEGNIPTAGVQPKPERTAEPR